MVSDAERYKAEDTAMREKIEARNDLEGYVFNIKNQMNDDNVKSKLDDSEKTEVDNKVNELL